MDKPHEESRKQFDAWWHEEYCHLAGSDEGVFVKYAAWQAWQASRASIVVELPEMEDFELLDGYKVRESLRSIGLSIKGE